MLMMYKGSDLVEKPIISFDTGEIIERVKDVFFDAQGKRLLALLVDEGGIFAQARVLPFLRIKVIGPDAITVEHGSSIIVAESDPEISKTIEANNIIKGTKVLTEGGESLGTVRDIYFNSETGEITGYDISGGFVSDTYEGKSFLPADKIMKMGKDVVFVPNDAVELINEQVGGMRAAMQNAGSSIRRGANKMPSGEEGAQQIKDKAGQWWETIKGKTAEYRDTAAERNEQSKIKNALGRSVSRVILNEQDEPILDRGDLITHRSIQQARDAGVLDILLDSVSNESISYNESQMKAASKGGEGKNKPDDEMPTDTTIIIDKSQ